jgi:RNA polymerase sigma factor (sigma-70 family)
LIGVPDSTRAEHPSTGSPCIIKSICSETELPAREDRLEAPLPEIAPGSIDLDDALRRCAQGDRTALRMIYDAEAARMLGVALRLLHRRALAEEAVHDAFVQIWRHAETFDPARGRARAWLYAVLRHRALNIRRDEDRTELTDDLEPLQLPSEGDGAESLVIRLSETSALRRCLERLEPARREAITLAYVEGLSHRELAGRLGVPVGTAKSWIRRSLLVLRDCLE